MAEHFEVSTRTIERDLSALQRAGVPIYATPGQRVDEVTSRTVEPVAVLGVRPHWYLWAYRRLREAPRVFRFDRIRRASLLEEPVRDRGLDPAGIELDELINRGILGDLDGGPS